MSKILVIEDNFEVRDNLCEILELASYDVISAENGKIGIELAINQIPDLILCDVMMPELDGFGVLKILGNHIKTKNIPFIFLTAKSENIDFRKGMGLGADDYITKPFDDTDLLEAIEMRIAKSKQVLEAVGSLDNGSHHFFSKKQALQELDNMSSNKERRKYNKKDIIYEENGTARWLYFIESGVVKICQTNEFGKELIAQILRKGDFFGYYPLLLDQPYIDNAVVLENTELKLIPKQDFIEALLNNRNLTLYFIQTFAEKGAKIEKQLIELAYSSVRRKVAQALLAFVINPEKGSSDYHLIRVSRENLAAKAGTAKETLIRTLSDFKSEKIIEIVGSHIHVLDKDKLKNMPQ